MNFSIKSALVAMFAVVTLGQSAQASLLLEPYLGYISGESKQSTTSKYTGTTYGLRAGYSMLGFAVGAEYAAMSATDDSSPKNDLKSGDLGLFAAYEFPILVRAYASFFPSAEVKVSGSGGSFTAKSGTATKLGVGFTGLPFVSLNLEYITSSYSKGEALGIEGDLNPKLTNTAYALSVSLPFDL